MNCACPCFGKATTVETSSASDYVDLALVTLGNLVILFTLVLSLLLGLLYLI